MTEQIVFCTYIVLCLSIGFASYIRMKKNKTPAHFLTADSSQHVLVVGASLFAACVSGTAVVGVSNDYYQYGLAAMTYSLSRVVLTLGMGWFVGAKIYCVKNLAVNQVFAQVFQPHDSVLFGIVSSLILTGVAGASIRAAALLLPSVYPVLTGQTTLCLVLVTLLCGVFSAAGGIRAVNLTNTLHALCIVLGALLISAAGIAKHGGLTAAMAAMPDIRASHWFDFGGQPAQAVFGSFLGVVVYSYVGQTEWNISRSARSAREAQAGFYISGIGQLILAVLLMGVGMAAVLEAPESLGSESAMAVAAGSISPLLTGIAVAAIFACSVSTAQGMYIAQSTITFSWMKCYCERKGIEFGERKQFRVMQILVVLLSGIAFVFSGLARDLIPFLVNLLSIYTPFAIVLLLVFYCPNACRRSTCTCVFIFSFTGFMVFLLNPQVKAWFSNISAYPLLIGTILGILVPLAADKRSISQII